MGRKKSHSAAARLVPLILAAGFIALAPLSAKATSPDSPEVKQMVERALRWLEKESNSEDRLGGRCLIALSFFKAGRPLTHPKIAEAKKACETSANTELRSLDNYSVGLALVFLLETDPEHNRSLARRYVQEVLRRQQRGGGWGYPENPQGDTSQTQYPALGLWLAINNGIDVPVNSLERVCGWLVRTQDPSGGWGYWGEDPGNYNKRVNQNEIRPSLVAAAMGTLYVCADVLGIHNSQPEEEKKSYASALKPVGDPLAVKSRPLVSGVESRLVQKAILDGNYWFAQHYSLDSEGHTHYYLYAYERYQSFREAANKTFETNPKWYNDVVYMLRKTQEPEGDWNGNDGAAVTTSFAVLTLLRSAKKTIASVAQAPTKLGDGILLGGMGLPKNTADIQEKDGKIVETPLAGTIEELVETIEKADTPELERLAESQHRWKLDSDVTKRSGEIAKLRSIVASGSLESRFLAVRALGRVRELDNVPLLVYALSDPDMRVVREADKGLRFISRKLDGVGIPEEPKPRDAKDGIVAWKAWYQSVRPSADLLD
jgi:hypothetical protein